MLGIILGFGSAMAFACNLVIIRRGVLRSSSDFVANVSILVGPVVSCLVAAVTGDLYHMGRYPWKVYVFFAISGIIHFAFGRTWAYKSIQMIGSNRTNIVTSLSPIVSITLAVIVFGETMNPLMILGFICALSSPFITLCKEQTTADGSRMAGNYGGHEVDRHTLYLGMLYGAGAALFWGSSLIFIKLGLENGGSPIAGNMIAYLGASLVIIPSLAKQKNREEMHTVDRKAWKLAILVGLSAMTAQLLRYFAVEHASVILVTAIIRTTPLGVLLLSFIYNRQHESFSRWVLLSNAILLVGTVMILKA